MGDRLGQRVLAEYGINAMVFNPFETEGAMVLAA
jgi:hypothetical protein